MATQGTKPDCKDANESVVTPTKYKHADTVGRPMQPLINPPPPVKDFPPLGRTDRDNPAAMTTDPRTEIQSVPDSVYPGRHSRDGHADVARAERGTGDGL